MKDRGREGRRGEERGRKGREWKVLSRGEGGIK